MKNTLLFLKCLIIVIPLFATPTRPLAVICNDINTDGICDFSKFIHVDQFGYLENAAKVAVICDPQLGFNAGDSFTPSATLQVHNASDDTQVFSGTVQVWNGGATDATSGDKGWWFDFSSLTTPGEYFIYDPIQEVRSMNFVIGDDVYIDVLKASMKMFYYNRCNATKATPYADARWADGMNFTNALQDANCRYIYDPNNASLEKDLTGGWFDAGDYNKYVTFTHSVMHDLLWAYQENPTLFGDDWNIPESGNGIPDLLDEIKWELDWLLKMTNADGSVHIKMGSSNYSDNTSAPPSANTDQRFYGPTCTAASISNASVFAHAAKVFETIPTLTPYASTLETNAENTWNYALPHLNAGTLETACDDGSIIAGDADWEVARQRENAVGAAIHLFDLTGEASYNTYVTTHYEDTEQMDNDYWSGYRLSINDALLLYSTLGGANATIANEIQTSFAQAASNNWEGFFGENNSDLYRAFIPNYSYHWGSNQAKAGYAVLNLQLVKYGLNPSAHPSYEAKAADQLHYFHGVNPMGLVYLSNMYEMGGDRCVNEIYHTWFYDGTNWDNAQTSLYGPAPGFVSGGANKDFTVSTLTPPYGQPSQKSYSDFNDGWPNNSWEISEPAIYYQARYIRLLASQTSAPSTILPVELQYFQATLQPDNTVALNWKTAVEINNDYFEIQRSVDGRLFMPLEKVAGVGNTTEGREYSSIDPAPLPHISYYRLKQVDLSGEAEYFPTVSIFIESTTELGISIRPNPTQESIHFILQSHTQSTATLELLSLAGKSMIRPHPIALHPGSNRISFPIDHLSSGIYILTVTQAGGKVHTQRVAVANHP